MPALSGIHVALSLSTELFWDVCLDVVAGSEECLETFDIGIKGRDNNHTIV